VQPVKTVVPKLPPILHNEYVGTIYVSFFVRSDGRVHAPVITRSSLRPIGRSKGEPRGYNEAVIAAVSEWRYPAGRYCRATIPIEFTR
jgi:hypothetical protein